MIKVRLVVVSVLLSLGASSLCAQTTGSIRGKVTDADGGPLDGATVTAGGDALPGGRRQAITGAAGGFSFPGLPVGVYSLRAEAEGFQARAIEGIQVRVSTVVPVDLRLTASFAEAVDVHGDAPIVNLRDSSVGTSFNAEFIEDLPLPRYFWDTMSIAPGVTSTFANNQPALIAFGTGVQSNSWRIDGIDGNSASLGGAWWYINPDTIEEVQVLGVGAPAEYGNMLGTALNVVTKSGGNTLKGSFNGYFQFDGLTDPNVTLDDSEFPEFHRETFRDVTGTLGGPLRRDRVWFFAAGQHMRDAFTEPGINPDFAPENASDKVDLKISSQLTDASTLDFKLHYEDWVEPEQGSAFKTRDALFKFEGTNPAWSVDYAHVLSSRTFFEAKYAGWWGDLVQVSQTGSTAPPLIDFSPPGGGPPVQSGGPIFPFDNVNAREQVDAKVSHFAEDFLGGDHDFKFGVQFSLGESETEVAGGPNGAYYTTTVYAGTRYYYKYFVNPYQYGADTESIAVWADDSWQLSDKLTLNVGVRWDHHVGDIIAVDELDENFQPTGTRIPGIDSVVEWSHVSPRLGFAYNPDERTVVRGSFGVFRDGVVTGNWEFPPPSAPPFQLFLQDPGTGLFDILLFQATPSAVGVDPDLEAPKTLQYSAGFERQLGNDMRYGAQLVYKETDDLIGWEILGDGVVEAVPWVNPVTGETQTLFNLIERPTVRKGNRAGATVLGPDTEYYQEYKGLILTFDKRPGNGWSLQSSYTWSESEGLIPRQFSNFQNNILLLSRTGTDPNQFINADQLLQGDREHMFRVQANVDLPWGLEATTAVNIQSGRAYNRQIQTRLSHGNVRLIAVPGNDDQRYPTQKLVDVSIGKRIALPGAELKLDAQVFNVLNDDAVDRWESLLVAPGDDFVPRGYVAPRRVMLRVGLRF